MEDLWAFNEEIVARAVFECSVPIISAVGHETDTTIVDYVADLRAATPSAAAELAVYDVRQLQEQLLSVRLELNRRISEKVERCQEKAAQFEKRLNLLSPVNQLNEKRQITADFEEKLRTRMEQQLLLKKHQLELVAKQLESFSPIKKLSQGYAFVADEKGENVHDVNVLKFGDTLNIHMLNGKVKAQVRDIQTYSRVTEQQGKGLLEK